MKLFKPSFLPAILWLILVTVLMTLPGSSFPKANWLQTIWLDKWIHIGLFLVLVLLWCRAMLVKDPGAEKLKAVFLCVAIAGLVYGIGMEFVQKYFIPNRSFDKGDILADAVGAAAGLLFSWGRYIKK